MVSTTSTQTTAAAAAAPKITWPRAPFPDDTPSHALLVVDFLKVQAGDAAEIETLYKACSTIGFFYLKNHGIDPEPIFEMGEATFALPEAELMEFEQGDSGMSAGYKSAGVNNVDDAGNKDTIQFINIAKDDALAFPVARQRTYPRTCVERMPTITNFVQTSDNVLQTLMNALEASLDLPDGTFASRHLEKDLSGSEARTIFKPAAGAQGYLAEGTGADGKPAAAIGAHTDFGSFSLLHGRGTGGLQVLPPGTTEWQWIRPIAGHAVCNVGDTLSIFSGGIFRSNIHRVVPPPGDQNLFTRWSLVYFIRPGFDTPLRPLSELSPKIKAAAEVNEAMKALPKGETAGSWFKRRIANQRIANKKPWAESRGTEHTPMRA